MSLLHLRRTVKVYDFPSWMCQPLMETSWIEDLFGSNSNRSNLAESEKLVYRQHALKYGSAKQAIEGLSRSGEYYSKAIVSKHVTTARGLFTRLMYAWYLMHPHPKTAQEKSFINYMTQHNSTSALKAMDYETSGPFITSILELKLDVDTMLEWQKQPKFGCCTTLSRASWIYQSSCPSLRIICQKTVRLQSEIKRPHHVPSKPVASFTTSTSASLDNCVLCKTDKHPFYTCPKFKVQMHDKN